MSMYFKWFVYELIWNVSEIIMKVRCSQICKFVVPGENMRVWKRDTQYMDIAFEDFHLMLILRIYIDTYFIK
jgi:hypothetical protein